MKVRADLIDLAGARFGKWTVRRLGDIHYSPSGGAQRYWVVRCDCGVVAKVQGRLLRSGNSAGCRACGRARMVAKNLASSRDVGDGRTIASIARACSLKLTTVDKRFRRGWPLWLLGAAPGSAPHGTGFGRDVRK